ncbi:MAG: hypothetical protein KC636_28100 [Myxococcales bacterium]|nr:hypothetical protein [Myxococcales bacterium]
MPPRVPWTTIGLCFGLGLALAPMLRPARACSCGVPSLEAALREIAGEGDRAVEEAYWEAGATFDGYDDGPVRVRFASGPRALRS